MTEQQENPPTEENEVSFQEAVAENEAPQEAQEGDDVLDILKPKAEPKKWTIGKAELTREYVQRPLSFIGKMQWFSLVGEVLDRAMGGANALSINSLMSAPSGSANELTMQDFRNADTFVHAVGKLLVYAPDFLTKSYAIWLGVPEYERDLVKQIMELPPEDGGLTDDQGLEIIEVFIDQNYEALDTFFREKLSALQDRIQARRKEVEASRLSKR
jgi:hypothetical protein